MLNAHSRLMMRVIPQDRAVERFLPNFFSSVKKEMEISLSEIVDVSEAMKRRRKKSVDQMPPPAIR